jgi:hypothetical protein
MTEPLNISARRPTPNTIALTKVVALQSARVVRSSTELLAIRESDVIDNLRLETKSGCVKSPDSPQGLRVFVGIECTALSRDEQRALAKVECHMALDYSVSDVGLFGHLTDEDRAEFASLNGLYNAWPYLREFCQSASLRMGLQPLVLPTLPPAQQPVLQPETKQE